MGCYHRRTATNAVCWHEKEQKEQRGTKGRKSCGFEESRRYFSRLFVNVPFLQRNHGVSRIASLEIAILKNGKAGHFVKDGDDFHLAAPRLVAERNVRP